MDFSMQMIQRVSLRMEQKLSPQLIQSMELLQLPMMELEARIDQEMQENPTLELASDGDSPDSESEQDLSDKLDNEFDKLDAMDQQWDQYFQAFSRPRSSDRESDVNQAIANTAAPPETLQKFLEEQIHMIDLPKDLIDLAEAIIYNIDDGGYLRYPLNEVMSSFNGRHTLREALQVLRIIQTLGPPGVGARNMTECLLLQLGDTDGDLTLEKLLITYHMNDVQNNRIPKIVKDTGRPIEEVKAAIDRIAHLNPRPGEKLSSSHARYIVPDMTVRFIDDKYEISLTDTFLPAIRVSPYYRNMLKAGGRDPRVLKYVRGKIGAANWLISSLEQRRDTLQRIGNQIVSVQKDFFEEGVSGLKPLRMQDVADAVGIHVATVSRASADKYIDTPRGVYPIKFFFSGGLPTTTGQVQARKGVEGELKVLIDAEDKRHPISDGAIVTQLKEKGVEIARRTVAKYRNKMGIPSASLRKEHQ